MTVQPAFSWPKGQAPLGFGVLVAMPPEIWLDKKLGGVDL
jgi:hypothetical protein